jgi:outer membrane protein
MAVLLPGDGDQQRPAIEPLMKRTQKSHAIVLCSVLILAVSRPASAQEFLESARRTDLNDYAFGIALSVNENPFVGASTSTFSYPYLTALEHPAFNKDWFLIRDGDIGIRYVTDNEWELAWVTRVQTLGLGGTDNDEIDGLLDRRWSIESGPMVGWRRLPVHIGLKHYWELLDRHSGTITELAFSLPGEFDWGYVVPSLELRYLDEDYAAYYYGVRSEESNASRPEYSPGSVVNPYAALRVGYRLGRRWMLTGKIGLTFLDSAIRESPVVEKDRLWSTSIGLAYNADMFRPREYDAAAGFPTSLEFRFGAFSSKVDSTVQRFGDDGRPGDKIDVESVLGAANSDTTLQAEVIMRFMYYQRLEASYFDLGRNSTTILDRDIVVGDETFLAGTEVTTTQDSETLQLVYGYSILRDAQKEFGLSAGLHYTRSEIELFSPETAQRVRLETEVPLPTIGAFASVTLANRWSVEGEARAFALEFDRYEGSMGFFAVRLERDLGRYLSAGIGFNYYTTRIESQEVGNRGVYEATRYGPLLYLGMQF